MQLFHLSAQKEKAGKGQRHVSNMDAGLQLQTGCPTQCWSDVKIQNTVQI